MADGARFASNVRTVLNAAGEVAAEISIKPKWVQVVSLKLGTVAEVQAFQRAIDGALMDGGKRRVLVDARQALIMATDMNESMWRWVRTSQHFDRLAIVNQSPTLTVAVRMKAMALGTKKVQVVHQFQEAAHWLVNQLED